MTAVDWSKVTPIDEARSDRSTWSAGLDEMLDEALGFLQSFGWCGRVRESYLGTGIPGVVAVFLFRIAPKGPKVDELIWVVVGDVPPAYLVTDNAPNPAAALDAYIGEMETWVRAARSGESVSGLIPVNVPPTTENAEALQRRLKMLDDLLRDYEDDLKTTE